MKAQQPYHRRHGGYVSEFDQFLGGFVQRHPDVEKDQQRGWYKLWDKQVDLDELAKEQQDHVPLPPYSYE